MKVCLEGRGCQWEQEQTKGSTMVLMDIGVGGPPFLTGGSELSHLVQSFVNGLYGGQKCTIKLANRVNSEHYRRPYIESFCP